MWALWTAAEDNRQRRPGLACGGIPLPLLPRSQGTCQEQWMMPSCVAYRDLQKTKPDLPDDPVLLDGKVVSETRLLGEG